MANGLQDKKVWRPFDTVWHIMVIPICFSLIFFHNVPKDQAVHFLRQNLQNQMVPCLSKFFKVVKDRLIYEYIQFWNLYNELSDIKTLYLKFQIISTSYS